MIEKRQRCKCLAQKGSQSRVKRLHLTERDLCLVEEWKSSDKLVTRFGINIVTDELGNSKHGNASVLEFA